MESNDKELLSAEDIKEVKEYVDQNGVAQIEELLKKKLERWREVEVNIGITGDTGTGKSSFINAIRGLQDDDDMAAEVGFDEMTSEPSSYDHPTNPKIKFVDLPGIGTDKYPTVEKYCEKISLEKYHAFLIFTGKRLRASNSQLIRKIKEMNKRFFFICAIIDEDVEAVKRKKSNFDEDAVLEEIRNSCFTKLASLLKNEIDVFLISNHYPAKWDFERLTQAILDALPEYQRESLTMSLEILTTSSTKILQRKLGILKKRKWVIASVSAAAGAYPLPGLSIAVDIMLITEELSLYRSQLGIPEEGSARFAMLSDSTQKEVKAIWATLISASQVGGLMAAYHSEQVAEEAIRLIPFVGFFAASAMSFVSTYLFLQYYLGKMEKVALLVLEEASNKFPTN